ncbi:predicted protein [Coccidioides posadasii str. Silveira]|uniref:Predicted protein n=1 Tax=Coccidioides posadasii (strain RMSCC 757 / Silveira) TaxID=443226 RepID=E9D4M1_COCPS|nr:predicted protein [Coccidioides posadasii str. Silveira]
MYCKYLRGTDCSGNKGPEKYTTRLSLRKTPLHAPFVIVPSTLYFRLREPKEDKKHPYEAHSLEGERSTRTVSIEEQTPGYGRTSP